MIRGICFSSECRKKKEEHSSRSRSHLKFLSGNYLTNKVKSYQSGGSSRYRICETRSDETISQVISTCQGLTVEREKILAKLCTIIKNDMPFEDPLMPLFYKLSRDFCHVKDNTRIRFLKEL